MFVDETAAAGELSAGGSDFGAPFLSWFVNEVVDEGLLYNGGHTKIHISFTLFPLRVIFLAHKQGARSNPVHTNNKGNCRRTSKCGRISKPSIQYCDLKHCVSRNDKNM